MALGAAPTSSMKGMPAVTRDAYKMTSGVTPRYLAITNETGSGQGTVVKMEPMKRLEILTQVDKDKDLHVFELRPSGGFFGLNADECKVTYTLDTLAGGGMLGNFISGGNPADALRVKKATHLLRKLVESMES